MKSAGSPLSYRGEVVALCAAFELGILGATAGVQRADAFSLSAAARQQTFSTTVPSRVPPMGWQSFKYFQANVSEDLIKQEADALVSSGLKAAGYDYLQLDGGWRASTRDANGNMQADPAKFPDGISAVADYAHSKGLKFGLHQAVGMTDCSGKTPGTQSAPGGEQQDANLFASWGVDYLKYDLCKYQYPANAAPSSADIDAIAVQGGQQPIRQYEAESAANTTTGEARAAPCQACSGGSKVTGIGLKNGNLEFHNVTVPRDGDYTLDIRYVDAYIHNAQYDSQHRMTLLSVNNGSAAPVYYPDVTTTGTGIVNGHTASVQVTVNLHQGQNTLTFSDPNSWEDITRAAYQRMADAIKKTGRPMLYQISEYGNHRPWLWAPGMANFWRTTGDIADQWSGCSPAPGYTGQGAVSITCVLDEQDGLASYAGPGKGWNYPNTIEAGLGHLTTTEYKAQFSLWSVLASPLIIGFDIRNMTTDTKDIVTNRQVIAVDQDPLGAEGQKVSDDGDHEVWVKPLANGDRAVVLFNRGDQSAAISTGAEQIGMRHAPEYTLSDLWANTNDQTSGPITADVPAHGAVMYRVGAS